MGGGGGWLRRVRELRGEALLLLPLACLLMRARPRAGSLRRASRGDGSGLPPRILRALPSSLNKHNKHTKGLQPPSYHSLTSLPPSLVERLVCVN